MLRRAPEVKKTLDAENVGLLKHMLEMELRRLSSEGEIDIILFMGVDGRIFSSCIPDDMDVRQNSMLHLVRGNLPSICAQLRSENMKLSVQQYRQGTLFIAGVGKNAFLLSVVTSDVDITKMEKRLKTIIKASRVIKHIFKQRAMTDEVLNKYPPEIGEELRKLSRLLFKERFIHTKEYQKNMEILEIIKKKVRSVVGKGAVEEMITLTFNEMGVRPANMDRHLWMIFLEKIIKDHITRLSGEIIADECMKSWVPEIEQKLRSFV